MKGVIVFIAALIVIHKCWQIFRDLFGDRSGNSGRFKHWSIEDE
jgi:hypothetical protein